MFNHRYGIGIVGLCAGLFAARTLVAGPLDPPSGAIAPTYKTLSEVEPRIPIGPTTTPGAGQAKFRIVNPGSYYLTGNIQGNATEIGILVNTNNVTIDLNGYALIGSAGSVDAINIATSDGVTIKNGRILGWGGAGINASSSAVFFTHYEDIQINNVGGIGMRGGVNAIIRHCSLSSIGSVGIVAASESNITDCIVRIAGEHGIQVSGGSTVERCISRNNSGDGVSVLGAVTGVSITNCNIGSNGGDGIEVHTGSLVRGNTITISGSGAADGAGVHVLGSQNRIEGNNISLSDRGVDVNLSANLIIGNTCVGNAIDFAIATGNTLGPIINAATNGTLIGGSSAPGTIGSADPWANICY